MTEKKPWHGVIVATALPFNDDLSVDYDSFAKHVAWLAATISRYTLTKAARWRSRTPG